MFLRYFVLATVASLASAASVKRARPYYCYIDKYNAANDYTWDDESPTCSFGSEPVGEHCCDVFIFDGGASCPAFGDQQDINNLKNALAGQIPKDGAFKTTTFGKWTCGFQYTIGTTAIPNRYVELEWFKGIDNLVQSGDPFGRSRLSGAYFSLDGNVISCSHFC